MEANNMILWQKQHTALQQKNGKTAGEKQQNNNENIRSG
jgi:hypothetical protein